MSLTESNLPELHDKKFDKLFEKHKAEWMEVTGNAYQVTKEHVCGGKPPRQDDMLKVLTPMLETNETFRKHQKKQRYPLQTLSRSIRRIYDRQLFQESTGGGTMSHEERMEVAKQYVDKQLETMKKYGSAPQDISEQERQALAEEVASTLKS